MQAKNIIIKKRPNNLLGTERNIAYKGKKYHSGTICVGVNIGFASIKLSACPKTSGTKQTQKVSAKKHKSKE